MRLFTGIDLPPDVRLRIDNLIEELRPAARLKWSVAANLHITTKFIGEWPAERVGELEGALRSISPGGPISISVHSLGFFPNARSPRVFWAGVVAPSELTALACAIDEALQPLGIEPEKRAFSPHLTLARIREPVPLDELRRRIERLGSHEFGSFTAPRFYLYQSKLSLAGSVYTKLSEFSLKK